MTNNGDHSAEGENAATADNSANTSVNVSGSNNQTFAGNSNKVNFGNRVQMEGEMSPPTDIDLVREIAALRELLVALETPDARKMERALFAAEDEAEKAKPDENKIREALERWSEYAKAANNLSEHVAKIVRHIAAVAASADVSF